MTTRITETPKNLETLANNFQEIIANLKSAIRILDDFDKPHANQLRGVLATTRAGILSTMDNIHYGVRHENKSN